MTVEAPMTTGLVEIIESDYPDFRLDTYVVPVPKTAEDLIIYSRDHAANQINCLRESFRRNIGHNLTDPDMLHVGGDVFMRNYRATMRAIRGYISSEKDQVDLQRIRDGALHHLSGLLNSILVATNGIDGYRDFLDFPVFDFFDSSLYYMQKSISRKLESSNFDPSVPVGAVSGLFKALLSGQEAIKVDFREIPQSVTVKGDPDALTLGLFHLVYHIYKQVLFTKGNGNLIVSFRKEVVEEEEDGIGKFIVEIDADTLNQRIDDKNSGKKDKGLSAMQTAIDILDSFGASYQTRHMIYPGTKRGTQIRVII